VYTHALTALVCTQLLNATTTGAFTALERVPKAARDIGTRRLGRANLGVSNRRTATIVTEVCTAAPAPQPQHRTTAHLSPPPLTDRQFDG
jgi:hypothetical protein